MFWSYITCSAIVGSVLANAQGEGFVKYGLGQTIKHVRYVSTSSAHYLCHKTFKGKKGLGKGGVEGGGVGDEAKDGGTGEKLAYKYDTCLSAILFFFVPLPGQINFSVNYSVWRHETQRFFIQGPCV